VIAGPTKQIYGAQVSGTVFASIANKVYSSSLQYHPNFNALPVDKTNLPVVKAGSASETIIALDKIGVDYPNDTPRSGYVVPKRQSKSIALVSRSMDRNKVPNVVGMPLNDAVYLLENAGMRVSVVGSGRVTSQSLSAGKNIVKGETVKLVLS
jgi:cell division protein FtsI (penicillin-binding protein 3)